MPIFAKAGATFAPTPAGAHPAVCIDVVDLGELEVTFGGKTKKQHKIKIVWEIEELRDDGQPFRPSKRYTLSLHEKAGLRKDLESWRGRGFTDEELRGFDVEVLLGKGCMINVVHTSKDGSTYGNITAIMKLPKGAVAPTPDRSYVRVCDRQTTEGHGAPPVDDWSSQVITDDDVPF